MKERRKHPYFQGTCTWTYQTCKVVFFSSTGRFPQTRTIRRSVRLCGVRGQYSQPHKSPVGEAATAVRGDAAFKTAQSGAKGGHSNRHGELTKYMYPHPCKALTKYAVILILRPQSHIQAAIDCARKQGGMAKISCIFVSHILRGLRWKNKKFASEKVSLYGCFFFKSLCFRHTCIYIDNCQIINQEVAPWP